MSNQVNQSGNRIYGNPPGSPRSVIQRSIADSTLKHKDKLVGIVTPPAVNPGISSMNTLNRSSDIYYKTFQPPVAPRTEPATGLPSTAVILPTIPGQVVLQVGPSDDLRVKLQETITHAQNGYPVTLVCHTSQLSNNARVFLDQQVTRNVLSDEAYALVTLRVLNVGVADVQVVDDTTSNVVIGEGDATAFTEAPLEATIGSDPEETEIEDIDAFMAGDEEPEEVPPVVAAAAETVTAADDSELEDDDSDA